MLEVRYDKSTFAIATWRGDAQQHWLTQALDLARAGRDQRFQSPPAQQATPEIVTGSLALRSTQCMMNTSMPVKGKYRLKEKAEQEMVKVERPIGEHLVTSSGNLADADKDTIVQSIIQEGSQADVQSVAQPATTLLNAHVQSSLKPRLPSGTKPQHDEVEWLESTWETEEYETSKGKKGKGKVRCFFASPSM